MQSSSSRHRHRAAVSVPLHWALCLCLAAFLAGRWLTRSGGSSSSSSDSSHSRVQEPDAWSQQLLQQSGILQQRPPLQPGASGNSHYTLAPYQILSWYPRLLVFPHFIDDSRAAAIIRLASQQLQPSTVRVRGVAGEENELAPDRSSSGAFLTQEDDPSGALAWLERKIQDVTLLPASHGEKFYVIKYEPGEEYRPHLDPHPEAEFGAQDSRRLATVVVYLNEVGSGGETLFPREGRDGSERPVGPSSCKLPHGLRYTPRKGDAVLFWSQTPGLALDPHSVHAGCPVGRGAEKWVVTKWIRDKPLVPEGGFGWG